MGAKIDYKVLNANGPYTFRIHGQNYHRIGSLLPIQGSRPQYAQLYIYDTDHEIQNRMIALSDGCSNDKIDIDIIQALNKMLDDTNIYVKKFRCVRDWYSQHKHDDFSLRILEARDSNGIQYNAPATNEIAALMIGTNLEDKTTRDVIICGKKKGFQRINETHPSYMPLQYPLLFPFGEDGWHKYLKNSSTSGSIRTRDNVTMQDYYAYRLQQRHEEGSTLLRSGKLFQQYIVDAYTAIEEYKLRWLRSHQSQLRCELYRGLHDAIEIGDTNVNTIGRKIVLPSSFTGGPKYMAQNYQDAMAICAWAGPPDLFITFTCNPKWPEIEEFLQILGGHPVIERPDIVSRVFHIKLHSLLDDLVKKKCFGRLVADLSVVEFQKRGLPHCHILITFEPDSKIKTPLRIDEFVRAELPDKQLEPVLHELVLTHMIHGPCGVHNLKCPCMKNGLCSKKYPKPFNEHTSINDGGFPVYRRSNAHSTILNDHTIDSSWVVPYNARLLLRYQCHLNVEVCNQRKAVKYLFKYVNKGADRATVIIQSNKEYQFDEIKRYLDSCYIAASEACWRIFEFQIHRRFPPVGRLQYHLLGDHLVYFRGDGSITDILETKQARQAMLTGWFIANKTYPQGKDLTYVEFPSQFVWKKTLKKWQPRKRGFSIGRLPYISPTSGERYYLRLLLTRIKGATSFADLRTVNGKTFDTFKRACFDLGLLEDDNEWHYALLEASNWASASQLRYMFVTILLFCEVTDPKKLWNSHWQSMIDDYQWRMENTLGEQNINFSSSQFQNKALQDIEEILNENNRTLKDFVGMPFPVHDNSIELENRLIIENLNYNVNEMHEQSVIFEKGLTDDQRLIYDSILSSCENNKGDLFFVHGGGGTGKTYLWNSIISKLRSLQNIVIVVASSGIASLLLLGGRTAHSRFKIPINIDECSTCSITRQSNLAKLIQKASLIIWDEAPMSSRYIFDAVDRSFKDIMQVILPNAETKPFGGKTVALAGDFRQILPVITKGTRHDSVASSLHKSHLWNHCKLFTLHKNMRLQSNAELGCSETDVNNFSKWLLSIGNGNVQTFQIHGSNEEGWIEIPDAMLLDPCKGITGLTETIYEDINDNYNRYDYIKGRAILACRNEEVDEINEHVLNIQEGQSRCYLSADSKLYLADEIDDDRFLYPIEFLNSLTFSGLPPYKLNLKANSPVMLLRNINPSIGLCNGTRLIIRKLGDVLLRLRF